MLKLARRERGHFVTLIEICMHVIRVKPGHISIKRSENYDNAFLNFSSRRCLKLTSLELLKMLKNYKFVHFKLVSFRGKNLTVVMPTFISLWFLFGVFSKISDDHSCPMIYGSPPPPGGNSLKLA